MTFGQFVRSFALVLDESTRALRPLSATVHPAQAALINAVDARDESGGRQYREFIVSWPRKGGKSTTAGLFALWALVADDLHDDREVALISSDLQQSKDAVFLAVRRLVARSPWLSARIRITATEAIYTEQREHLTVEHLLRVLPKDPRGVHGLNLSALVIDEAWVHDSWDLLEGISPSPARRAPMTLWSSYAGLRHQARSSVPWWDTLQRGRAGTDPRVFFSHLEGREGLSTIPWLKPETIARLEAQFEHVPSKFKRLILNQWATSDDGSAFLTGQEIADSLDRELLEPERPEPGVEYHLGADLGISRDLTGIIIAHRDARSHKLIVDVVRVFRGSKSRPLDLTLVEQELVLLARRFRVRTCVLDQWQAQLLASRLTAQGIRGVKLVTCDASWLDAAATYLKGVFSTRNITIPNDPVLVEQLEGLEGAELRRRDLVRFTATQGRHDDLPVALVLASTLIGPSIGRARLPDSFNVCHREEAGGVGDCYLLDSPGYIPPRGSDPLCRACIGHQYVLARWDEHNATRGGIDLRSFRQQYIEDNWFVVRHLVSRRVADYY